MRVHLNKSLKNFIRKHTPKFFEYVYYIVFIDRFKNIRSFINDPDLPLSKKDRLLIIKRFYYIQYKLEHCPHLQAQIIEFFKIILANPSTNGKEGVFLEAGCFQGCSTAKFSIAAAISNRRLLVFDSFSGLPESEKAQTSTYGHEVDFNAGDFCESLENVAKNVKQYGKIDQVSFFKGVFSETLPHLNEPVLGAYIDCDLASSTKDCLKYIYPKLVPGGVIISEDAHFPLVLEVYQDTLFWENEVGVQKPKVEILGDHLLLIVIKDCDIDQDAQALK